MSILTWASCGTEWGLVEKVSFNGYTRVINVNTGVTSLDIRADVYSAWVDWIQREPWTHPAIRYSGGDPIPGGETGLTFFLINNWKIVYDPNITSVSGVLYSENYPTPFYNTLGNPIYPATVSSLVNSAVSYQNVVTGTALTPSETADAVWQASQRTLTATVPTPSEVAQAVWEYTQ